MNRNSLLRNYKCNQIGETSCTYCNTCQAQTAMVGKLCLWTWHLCRFPATHVCMAQATLMRH
ncbi:putative protein S-acyltransferase 14 [Clarias magur]|uniref:Uncharacterized protein n=1 Tax=Clarias magur TaxID=1594786 RepID=A0A8J4TXC8_CLAMG|nr:putative protein S-acyltransferase 14 [Clarias magur]